ncbi:SusC/RagA family TonB-linked outer membrane protein [Pararcticibacter amylolyticus]|uniref:TonB-dependent receptor n=1 Tax=Pararcticibacter amylolyticus TaxID=2173175 RepID=A0A2U2PK98_9SPHI|nr:TonB-dependent receptor [Pararcticibacter amylolyticus]PWG81835.1 TonB-dependent receptor [Pararcticibacter amylolyticus]
MNTKTTLWKQVRLTSFLMCLLIPWLASAQIKVTGQVTDAGNQALPGVSIAEKGTNKRVSTDANGNYTITVSGQNAVLRASYIGFATIEIAVNGRTSVPIKLVESGNTLDEVMVTAYGTSKRSSFTGSASVINNKQISTLQPSNITQGLQGLSAGVQVINNSGRPGAEGTIVIRGLGSMKASTSPLYVIDGVPLDIPLSSLSYSDIESITVLKDAASTTLYGSRAGNGVVLITTKKGSSQKTVVNFRSNFSTSDFAVKYPEKVSAAKQYELTFEGLYNDATDFKKFNDAQAREYAYNTVTRVFWNTTPVTLPDGTQRQFRSGWNTDYPVGLDGKIKPDAKRLWEFDAFDEAFSHRLKQDYGVDISGAMGNKTNYFASASLLDDKGIFITDNFKRFTGRLTLNTEVNDKISFSNSLNYSSSTNRNGDYAARVFRVFPMEYSAYLWDHQTNRYAVSQFTGKKLLDEGRFNGRAWWPGWSAFGSLSSDVRNYNDNIQTVSSLNYQITNYLSFKSTYSYQLVSAEENRWNSPEREDQLVASDGRATRASYRNTSHTLNNVFTFDKRFSEKHHINALLGQEAYNYTTRGFGADRNGLDLPSYTEISTGWGDPTAWSGKDEYALSSFFSSLSYDYGDRYYLSASFRTDGSSRFKKENRWGQFWSAGASWRVTQEDFMKGTSSWLNDLKLKASYGEVGNDRVGYYPYMQLFDAANNYAGNGGVIQGQLANPSITWETNVQTNAGIEFQLFNKLTGSFELFTRKSEKLILDKPLAPSTGNNSITTNIGDLQNKGIEVDLSFQAFKTKDFDWTIGMNATHYKNKITRLPSAQERITRGVATFIWKEGNSRYDLYAPEWADVNPDNGRNRWWKKEFDASGKVVNRVKTENYTEVSALEQYDNVGSVLPDVFGSVTNTFRYHNLDLSVMLYYSLGGVMYDYNFSESTVLRENFAAYDYLDNRWTQPGQVTDVGKIYTYEGFNANSVARYSSKFVSKNDFARLRNLTVGYTIPRKWLDKAKIKNIRLYFRGDNLLTFGKLKDRGTDPENISVTGNENVYGLIDSNSPIPALRTYSVGLNVQF